jgi:hypothetical protein
LVCFFPKSESSWHHWQYSLCCYLLSWRQRKLATCPDANNLLTVLLLLTTLHWRVWMPYATLDAANMCQKTALMKIFALWTLVTARLANAITRTKIAVMPPRALSIHATPKPAIVSTPKCIAMMACCALTTRVARLLAPAFSSPLTAMMTMHALLIHVMPAPAFANIRTRFAMTT